MTELPSGTVTFLFTDIERSTQSVAAMGNEAYADALDTHRRLLRAAFESHHGHEVGREGDAFFVAFARAQNAVDAAIAGQHALGSHTLKVRMGIHTGDALVRDDDYVGHDVHKAKRISDAGHGGQILISPTTADLVPGLDVVDLGPHRLKDLEEAQRIYQVGAGEFPPLRSLESFSTNLPLQRSTFVGREHEIAEVRKHLERSRLVTLTGIGGCGKTRLALQVGAELVDAYPDGVFFIDLAPVTDPEVIPRAAAGAVGMTAAPALGGGGIAPPLDELLLDYLASRKCLLIVDNCEHLLDECADLADRILARCGGISILATSRESLDVEGEQSWRVPSLSIPEDATKARDSEAVSLFNARAQQAQPTFDLTSANVAAIADICRRLDGIPLAIELAAARITHLTPQQIADRLGDMFRLLTGGRRRVQRQQTLQAALDWSYELLDESERVSLRRLAVFAGSFGLVAAEQICSDDLVPKTSIVDLLGSLVAKSLVDTITTAGEVRYRLLETVRLYADEALRRSGESDAFRDRHRDWYASWVASIPIHDAYFADETICQAELELDNLRRAVEWSAAQDRPEIVGRVAGRLFALWWWGGHFEEGDRWLEIALRQPSRLEPEDHLSCVVSYNYAGMGAAIGHQISSERIDELAASPTGPVVVATAPHALTRSVAAEVTSDTALAEEARSLYRRAVEMADGLDSPVWRSHAQIWAATIEVCLGDYSTAVELYDAATGDLDAERYGIVAAFSLASYSLCLYLTGDRDGCVAKAAATEAAGRRLLVTFNAPIHYVGIAQAVAKAVDGRHAEAREILKDLLMRSRDSPVPYVMNEALHIAAIVELEAGRPDRASVLLAAGFKPDDAGGAGGFRSPMGYALFKQALARVRERLGAEERQRCRSTGINMSQEEALAFALEAPGK